MKISVITVVFNDVKNILYTMNSVINQTYKNIEYIIIDGNSHDGTKELIIDKLKEISSISIEENLSDKLYIESVHNHNNLFNFKFLSQKDDGIYYAMNKGIDLATGKWCNFMNCGDKFYNNNVIENIINMYNTFIKNGGGYKSIIYGNTKIIFDNNNSKILKSNNTNHKYHHHFIHQSCFIKTKLIKQYKYDTSFKIAGDTDFFTKAFNNKQKFMHFDIIVSCFNTNGVSNKLSLAMFIEDCKIGFKYNKLFPIFHLIKYLFYIIPRVCIRNSIPTKFRNKARVIFGKKTN